MTNTKIKDMIETIEQFAESQPDFPVYNILGEVHTYGDLKAHSDSLAAKIDSLDIPEKSPVVVYGGQEYEMLATFALRLNLVTLIFQLTVTQLLSA